VSVSFSLFRSVVVVFFYTIRLIIKLMLLLVAVLEQLACTFGREIGRDSVMAMLLLFDANVLLVVVVVFRGQTPGTRSAVMVRWM